MSSTPPASTAAASTVPASPGTDTPDPRLDDALTVLHPDGQVARPDLVPTDTAHVTRLYRAMRRARLFDERALLLQRQGRLGVYPLFGGMEATQVGAALALTPGRDWLAPTYRGSGCALAYGLPMSKVILNWRAHPDGFRMDPDLRVLPFYTPIANQLPHATGIALAEARHARREHRPSNVALAFVGDGGTSEGDFHVGLNFAGAYRAPAVFVIENNGWAISTPTSRQTAARTLASRGEGYGMPAVRVDGNDLLAVHHVTAEAVARARRGDGPTLIEAITYRILPHTSSDDPARYRDEVQAEAWKRRDPGLRLRAYLTREGAWDERQEDDLVREVDAELRAAVHDADAAPDLEPWELLEHVFETPTPEMREQQAELRALHPARSGGPA
ncbi:thiamine pyrophosphate-dependent dehydrogenase E1 component subunit alpha [Deinococcus aquiradiocola]|uniref:2-oxoisovalerate dehydrogenase subunit alpha n=1 Tax=Deinococcus aquiradiocola TaxID=393059 RepID=A0A917PBL3_9DEIO|nr:thiamine pyrophosphate-dependent dehydrogenase E1 component subunit alpha [Deinococcus aquiradiocola]GGJ69540.1 pyruvate dehydrogenase (acetyl-transferring) E1 component subunit alpha [Deinococcus aquiradiocola]